MPRSKLRFGKCLTVHKWPLLFQHSGLTYDTQNQMKNNPRSCDRNFYNFVKKPEKNSGLQRGLNPWPRDTGATLYQLSYEATDVGSRSRVQASLKSWIFFSLLYAIVKIAITTARIILHLISYPQFTYDLFHMHHSDTQNVSHKLAFHYPMWLKRTSLRFSELLIMKTLNTNRSSK